MYHISQVYMASQQLHERELNACMCNWSTLFMTLSCYSVTSSSPQPQHLFSPSKTAHLLQPNIPLQTVPVPLMVLI